MQITMLMRLKQA